MANVWQATSVSEKRPTIYTHTTKVGGPSYKGTIHFIEETQEIPGPLGWRHLVKRLVIRQWIHERNIWRERAEREPSRFELFFDLIFVGIIHQLADGATEVFSGKNAAKFVVLFFPSWTIWQDTRQFINTSGTDDILQRLYILVTMGLLLGYSANASAIELPDEVESEPAFPTLRAAILFFLVSRVLRLVIYAVYAISLPTFRVSQISAAAGVFVHTAVYFPLIWVRDEQAFWVLTGIGIFSDIALRYVVAILGLLSRLRRSSLARRVSIEYMPALNIEHHLERQSQFIIIVLGEAVLNLTFTAVASETGVHEEFARSILGLMSAYFLCWLYFDQYASHTYVHALRRHWFSAFSFNFLHYPLCCGLIVWSASMRTLVQMTEAPQSVRWYFGGGLAVALYSISLLGWMHKSLDKRKSTLIPHYVRIMMRAGGAIIAALLPLSDGLKESGRMLGVYTSVLAALVIFETIGKLGAVPDLDASTGDDSILIAGRDEEQITEQEVQDPGAVVEDIITVDREEARAAVEAGANDRDGGQQRITDKQRLAFVASSNGVLSMLACRIAPP